MPHLEASYREAARQAEALRVQARSGGLRFNAYLPPGLADWILDLIEDEIFDSPAEAVCAFMQERMELEPHGDLRDELLRRRISTAMIDPRPALTLDQIRVHINLWTSNRQEPACWQSALPESEI